MLKTKNSNFPQSFITHLYVGSQKVLSKLTPQTRTSLCRNITSSFPAGIPPLLYRPLSNHLSLNLPSHPPTLPLGLPFGTRKAYTSVNSCSGLCILGFFFHFGWKSQLTTKIPRHPGQCLTQDGSGTLLQRAFGRSQKRAAAAATAVRTNVRCCAAAEELHGVIRTSHLLPPRLSD